MHLRLFKSNSNLYNLIGHGFFIILLFFSATYYLERTIFVDSASYSFNIIQSGLPNITGRPAALISQIPLLISLKLGIPLRSLLLIYSVSFIALFYGIFIICTTKLKSPLAGLVIVLSLCLCVRDSFFYAITEVHQVLVYSSLLLAWLYYPLKDTKHSKWIDIAVGIILIILCYYTHSLALFTVLFIIGYYIIDTKRWTHFRLFAMIAFTLIIFSLKIIFTESGKNESTEFAQLGQFFELAPQFGKLFGIQFLINHSGKYSMIYIYVEVVLFILLLTYFYTKQFLKAAFIVATILLFIYTNSIIYANGESGMVIEKSFIPLGFFVAIPFINDVLLKINLNRYILAFALLLLLFFRIRDIGKTSKTYTQRLHYIERVCDYTKQFPERKFVIESKNIDNERIKVNWAFSIETLLFSSLDDPNEARTIYITEDINSLNVDLQNNDLLLEPAFGRGINANELDKRYFNIPDCSYRVLTENIE